MLAAFLRALTKGSSPRAYGAFCPQACPRGHPLNALGVGSPPRWGWDMIPPPPALGSCPRPQPSLRLAAPQSPSWKVALGTLVFGSHPAESFATSPRLIRTRPCRPTGPPASAPGPPLGPLGRGAGLTEPRLHLGASDLSFLLVQRHWLWKLESQEENSVGSGLGTSVDPAGVSAFAIPQHCSVRAPSHRCGQSRPGPRDGRTGDQWGLQLKRR